MTRVLYEEIETCYDCPYVVAQRDSKEQLLFDYCVEEWNNDETGRPESDFKVNITEAPPKWCPLCEKGKFLIAMTITKEG